MKASQVQTPLIDRRLILGRFHHGPAGSPVGTPEAHSNARRVPRWSPGWAGSPLGETPARSSVLSIPGAFKRALWPRGGPSGPDWPLDRAFGPLATAPDLGPADRRGPADPFRGPPEALATDPPATTLAPRRSWRPMAYPKVPGNLPEALATGFPFLVVAFHGFLVMRAPQAGRKIQAGNPRRPP